MGTDLYVALSEGQWPNALDQLDIRTLWLRRFDVESGAPRPFALGDYPRSRGQLAAVDGELVLAVVGANDTDLQLIRVGSAGETLSVLSGFEDALRGMGALQLYPQPGGLLVARESVTHDGLRVDRVSSSPTGELTLAASDVIRTPGFLGDLPTVSFFDAPGGVALATSASRGFDSGYGYPLGVSYEVQSVLMDPETLAVLSPWRRLSTPDLSWSVGAVLAAEGQQLVAVWYDRPNVTGVLPLVRSRCLSF